MSNISGFLNKILALLADKYSPVLELWRSLGGMSVKIAVAVIFLAVSVWLLGLLKVILEWVLNLLAVDKLADLLGVNSLLKRVDGPRFADLLTAVLYWIAMVGILLSTMTLLQVNPNVSASVNYLTNLLPNILTAVFIIIVAVLIAGFVANLIRLIASYFTDINGEVLAKASVFVILLYAVIISVGQLQVISNEMVNTILVISFVGFALAAALGSTKEAAELVKSLVEKAKALVVKKKR